VLHKILLSLSIIALTICVSNAQTRNFTTENSRWYNGQIQLKDGQIVKCKLNYNFVTDVLQAEHNGERVSYSVRTISSFTYLDESIMEEMTFYALPIWNVQYRKTIPTIVELLYIKNGYAIFSKHSFSFDQRNVGYIDPNGFYTSAGTLQIERVHETL
jgi:hypothetical protein